MLTQAKAESQKIVTDPSIPRSETTHIFAIGSKAAIVGSLLGLVGNLIHPATPLDDPQGVARVIADSDAWFTIHFGIVIGITLMFGGLIALYHSIRGGLPGALARFGLFAAGVSVAVGLILTILDGVAAKQLADEWASATAGTRFIALQNVLTNETINFALASLFNFIFAGVTFILFGLAVALSDGYPRWLGWAVVAAGVVSIGASLVQGVPGEPTTLSWILTIIGPTVITLWLLVIGVLMGRKASQMKSQREVTSPRSASFERL
ncbi:MAG: DUF4386 family protein [Actinomycetota bacterium]